MTLESLSIISDTMSVSPVQRLPTEILHKIFCYVEASDLLHCQRVCQTWKLVASNGVLWQVKLSDLFTRQSTIITCEQKPATVPDLNNLATADSYKVYQFISQYVQPLNPSSSKESRESAGNIIRKQCVQYTTVSPGFVPDSRGYEVETIEPLQIWIVGAGIDVRGKSCIFDDLRDNSIPDVTRSYAVGIHDRHELYMIIRHIATHELSLLYDATMPNKNAHRLCVTVAPLLQRTTSTPVFSDQSQRILQSPLFETQHTGFPITAEEQLSRMILERNYGIDLMNVHGLIYTVDARIPESEMTYLYHELRTLLQHGRRRFGSRVPVVILYVMPSEKVSIYPGTSQNMDHCASTDDSPDENRKSYANANDKRSWCGSLLLPLSRLRLYDLENPWRLQRCFSNDYQAVLQCIGWLLQNKPDWI